MIRRLEVDVLGSSRWICGVRCCATVVAAILLATVVACGGAAPGPGAGRAPQAGSGAAGGLVVGELLPDLLLGDGGGGKKSLREMSAGKVLLVDVWATWCVPCRMTAPHIQALHNRFRERGFTAIGIMVDDEASRIGPKVVADERPVYPQLFDDGQSELTRAWGGTPGLPFFVLVDRDGKVLRADLGASDLEGLKRAVEAAVRGQAPPTAPGVVPGGQHAG